jgi:hypothetical protein
MEVEIQMLKDGLSKITTSGEILTETETAKLLQVSRKTLQEWRKEDKGPEFEKVGKSVRYCSLMLIGWMLTRELNEEEYPWQKIK